VTNLLCCHDLDNDAKFCIFTLIIMNNVPVNAIFETALISLFLCRM
jgi:hypothetical protein